MTSLPDTQSGAFPVSVLDDRDVRMTRRTVIAGAVAATAAAATAVIETPARAGSVSPNTQEDMVAFLLLSAALTGVRPAALAPEFRPAKSGVNMLTSVPDPDPFDVERDYFKLLYNKDAQTFEAMLQIAKDHRESAPDIIDAISNNEATMYLGRSLVLLWYLGAWYDPAKLKEAHLKANPEQVDHKTVEPEQTLTPFMVASPKAYTRGLLWKIAQAHPMGYSELQFGYWSRSPVDPNDIDPKTKMHRGPIDFITNDFRST
jgi:hypothetical protein